MKIQHFDVVGQCLQNLCHFFSSETFICDHKKTGQERNRQRVPPGGKAIRYGVRDHWFKATRGDNLVQGSEKTAEAHDGKEEK